MSTKKVKVKKLESDVIEFKESWSENNLKTISAFVNTSGGTLSIGINDKGEVVGLPDTKKLLEDIPNIVRDVFGLTPEVKLKKLKGKEYLEVRVKSSDNPVSLRGKYYVRSGSTNQELKNDQLTRFLLDRSGRSWESALEDFDEDQALKSETIESFISRAKNFPRLNDMDLVQVLNKLHLSGGNGKIMRAGILLFGKQPQSLFPGAIVRIAKFSEQEVPLSTDEIRGNLFEQAEGVMAILKSKYLISELRIDGLYRNDFLEYPESALREAIINALAHKDYSGPHIQIKVYNDRLTFWNSGELPGLLTIEALRKTHSSHPRNKKIADVFYKSGLIEAWGSGTMKMIDDCRNVGLPEPIFEERDGGILVTFSKDVYTEQFLKQHGLTERQIMGINFIKSNGSINNARYQQLTGTAKRTVSRDLTELVEKGLIEKSGTTGKGTAYRLKGQRFMKNNISGDTDGATELDKKLLLLDKALEAFDPDEEIKIQFSKELFIAIFDGWISLLLKEIIPVIQKFNRYFINPGHQIHLPNGTGYIQFINEEPGVLLDRLRSQLIKNIGELDKFQKEFYLNTSYGSFRRAGMETFGANYTIHIMFDLNWYEISMNEEVMQRSQVQQFKRQYHKPIIQSEAMGLAERFGDLIFRHITTKINTITAKPANGA